MTKLENRIFDFVRKNITLITLAGVTLFGLLIRICGIDFISGDFRDFLNPWWEVIKSKGIDSLGEQIGNYNIPYQIIIYLMTLLPVQAVHAYKVLSIVFDVAMALSAALVVDKVTGGKKRFLTVITYAFVFCSFTVILNSAFWGQCDSIYVTFILLAVYFIFDDKPIPAFIMLGVSLAFKLQVFFILPVFLFYYIANRNVSVLHFLIIPLTDIVLCLPTLLFGRDPWDIINIYITQTDYGKLINMNCPNFYSLICLYTDGTYYYLFKKMSIFLTFLVLAIALSFIIRNKIDLGDKRNFLLTAIWTSFTCLMFLSSMHERYGYLLDVLLIIYALLFRKHIITAVICNLVSLRGYAYYLFGNYQMASLQFTSIVYFGVYVYISISFFKTVAINGKKLTSKPVLKTEATAETEK